jgi:hypothetical protein
MGRAKMIVLRETQEFLFEAQSPTMKQSRSYTLDAGRRVVETYELLELCLLHLANEDILLAQSVSKRFKSIINTSSRLRKKLFFTPTPMIARVNSRATVNPIFAQPNVQSAIPLFFDHEKKRLTGVYHHGCTRLYCRSVSTTRILVHMDLSSENPVCSSCLDLAEASHRTRILDVGSWRQMYLSQPSCLLSWRVELTGRVELRNRSIYTSPQDANLVYHGFLGAVRSESTLGDLLGGLTESSVVEGI